MSQKLAISIKGGWQLDAPMDPRFGRAPAFLFVDSSSGALLESEANSAAEAAHGAGTATAAAMKRHGVTGVISGHFGPKAYEALRAMKIQMWNAPPGLTAGQAVELFLAGELQSATVEEFR